MPVVLLLATFAVAARGEAVDYLKQVKPILAERCFACHGVLKEESGLRLDASGRILQGGDSGEVIVPGASAESLLVEKITAEEGERMPPEGPPLSAEQIKTIERWIDEGAKAPEEALPPHPRDHWAFQLPKKPALPITTTHPIDALLAAQQQGHGLTPLGPAAKQQLLRRVYLDLAGLPPTPEELHAFLADTSPQAYEQVVEHLLASPHYGERWGRHWMDIWRYTDFYGLEGMLTGSQRHIWRWRDWIIESLNEDKPYDRMIVEMLAADEAAPGDRQVGRATGFLARNYHLHSRDLWLEGLVEHTSRGLLGLTIQCAKCHDHKYDPIAQQDYYRLRAFFEPHRVRTDRLPGQSDLMKDGSIAVYDDDTNTPTYLYIRGDEKNPDKSNPLEPGVPELFGGTLGIAAVPVPLESYYPDLREFVRDETLAAARNDANSVAAEALRAQTQLADLQRRVDDEIAVLAEKTPAVETFLADKFSEARPELWAASQGDWRWSDGRLMQMQTSGPVAKLVSLKDHPRDFSAALRFRIRGGDTRSVGMVFDSDDRGCTGIFVSPMNSKVQLYQILDGKEIYPESATKKLPVENGREYELKFAVEDRKLSVWVDGVLQFVHQLGFRRTGKLALTSYQAAAEFLSINVLALHRAGGDTTKAALALSMSHAELTAKLAEARATAALVQQKLTTRNTYLAATEARLKAETAKYTSAPASQCEELARAAARLERSARVARAQYNLAATEREEARLRAEPGKAEYTKAEAKLKAAQKELADAGAAARQEAGDYSPLGTLYPKTSTGRRLALARWIANDRNPLTARVAVNHIWTRHFGQPLVGSMFDFGLRTKAPELQNVLDYLAVDFVEHGWSMKHLHRLIVTSAAYRRQSLGSPESAAQLKLDPDNHFYWCVKPKRMEAEVIRDSLLYATGKLDSRLGGPDLPAASADETTRRTLYYRYAREERVQLLTMFDAPNTEECYRREDTIVPQQSLALMNSRLSLGRARDVATRIAGQLPAAADNADIEFTRIAFEMLLGRVPSDQEYAACKQGLARFEELAGTQADKPARVARAREQLVHVLVNHNDFITIR